MKAIEIYKRSMVAGELIGGNGLCDLFRYPTIYCGCFDLFKPDSLSIEEQVEQGYLIGPTGTWRYAYWASNDHRDMGNRFNKTRQNIVLLIAAMNNEL